MSVRQCSWLIVLALLSTQGSFQIPSEDPLENTEVDGSYQRRYIINVAPKTEECFYIPSCRINQRLDLNYAVVSHTRGGFRMDITMKVKSPTGKLANFQPRRAKGNFTDYLIPENGDYEICFNNRFSMTEHKRVFWEFGLEGAVDERAEEVERVNASLTEYMEESKVVEKGVRKVRGLISRARHQQWWRGSNHKKDEARMEIIKDMIDRWSIIHSIFLCTVGVGQVYFLRRMFNSTPVPHKLSARA